MDVFIGNLSPQTTLSDLVTFFKGFAGDARFQLFDKQFEDGGRARYAVASIDSDKLAQKAIKKLTGQYLRGNTVILREFHHRSYNNERRAVGWRGKPWQGVERRDLERRRKIAAKPDDIDKLLGITKPRSEAGSDSDKIKIEARSLFARKH